MNKIAIKKRKDDIFLSYASEDRGRAKIFAETLEKNGYSIWWDKKIPGGKVYAEYIEEKLNEAKCVIVLWSNNSVKSLWVKEEADSGNNRGILVPVLIDNVKIPFGFGLIQAVPLTDWKGDSTHIEFDMLLQTLAEIVGTPVKEANNKPVIQQEKPPEPIYSDENENVGTKFVATAIDATNKNTLPDVIDSKPEKTEENEGVFPEGRLTREDVEHAIRKKISLAKRDMSYANLKGLDFSDMDLTEADFSNATLTDAKIINTNLTGADFYNATLTDTKIINSNLTAANLSSAELSGANLSNSKLSGAKLYHTNLDHSTLNEANLAKLDFSQVQSIKGADFSKAVLTKATLSNVDLSGAILKKANLSNANLSGAILIKANLSNANLSGANMRKINLSGAILNEADLTETDLSNANLSGAKLIKAYLARANLSKADLKETDLSNAKLMGAVLDRANIKGAIMSGVEVDDETSTKGINLMGKWKFHSDNTEIKKALLEIDKELRKIICRDNKNDDDYRQICNMLDKS